MSWARFDDEIINGPQMRALASNPLARLLFYESYIWSCRENTDGSIDDVVILGLCRGFEQEMQLAIDALVKARLWTRWAAGYYIAGFMESGLQKPRAQVLAEREHMRQVRAEAGRKGAEARKHLRVVATSPARNGVEPSGASGDRDEIPF